VIARDYLAAVEAGIAATLGAAARARVREEARRAGLPVRDLRRVDLP